MNLPIDHSRGFKPAKAGDHRAWGVRLFHNVCGKPVRESYAGWSCSGPCSGWHPKVMDGFNDDAMACRFHVRPNETTGAAVKLIWKVDEFSKQSFSTVVPVDDSTQRFK